MTAFPLNADIDQRPKRTRLAGMEDVNEALTTLGKDQDRRAGAHEANHGGSHLLLPYDWANNPVWHRN